MFELLNKKVGYTYIHNDASFNKDKTWTNLDKHTDKRYRFSYKQWKDYQRLRELDYPTKKYSNPSTKFMKVLDFRRDLMQNTNIEMSKLRRDKIKTENIKRPVSAMSAQSDTNKRGKLSHDTHDF